MKTSIIKFLGCLLMLSAPLYAQDIEFYAGDNSSLGSGDKIYYGTGSNQDCCIHLKAYFDPFSWIDPFDGGEEWSVMGYEFYIDGAVSDQGRGAFIEVEVPIPSNPNKSCSGTFYPDATDSWGSQFVYDESAGPDGGNNQQEAFFHLQICKKLSPGMHTFCVKVLAKELDTDSDYDVSYRLNSSYLSQDKIDYLISEGYTWKEVCIQFEVANENDAPEPQLNPFSTTIPCDGSEGTICVENYSSDNTYSWTVPDGWIITGYTNDGKCVKIKRNMNVNLPKGQNSIEVIVAGTKKTTGCKGTATAKFPTENCPQDCEYFTTCDGKCGFVVDLSKYYAQGNPILIPRPAIVTADKKGIFFADCNSTFTLFGKIYASSGHVYFNIPVNSGTCTSSTSGNTIKAKSTYEITKTSNTPPCKYSFTFNNPDFVNNPNIIIELIDESNNVIQVPNGGKIDNLDEHTYKVRVIYRDPQNYLEYCIFEDNLVTPKCGNIIISGGGGNPDRFISVYPNPVTDIMNVNITTSTVITGVTASIYNTVYNMPVYQQNLGNVIPNQGPISINVSGLQPGQYAILIQSNEGMVGTKQFSK